MWNLVFFDLPTDTKKQRKVAHDFRKNLIKNGYVMFQYSNYVRHCASMESSFAHRKRVKSFLPSEGDIRLMSITDKQFGEIEIYHGTHKEENEECHPVGVQLEMF
jgi:CRISPR-associated protein Cas2